MVSPPCMSVAPNAENYVSTPSHMVWSAGAMPDSLHGVSGPMHRTCQDASPLTSTPSGAWRSVEEPAPELGPSTWTGCHMDNRPAGDAPGPSVQCTVLGNPKPM